MAKRGRVRRVGLLAMMALAVVAEAARAEQFVLMADSNAKATIVAPANGSRLISFAARELQRYVAQMTGARLPIGTDASGAKIKLATTARFNENDAFHIRTGSDELLVEGASDHAVLNGVYWLLERMGCRWFGPGEELVPSATSLSIPQTDVIETPGLHWRGLELISGSNPAIVDWMAKMRLNVAWPEGYAPNKDLTVSEASMNAAAVPQMRERGMTIFWGGHILPVLFPVERYRDHPEYFALIKGKRLNPDESPKNQNQLCVSNSEVLRILTENTVIFLRNHPWIDMLFLWGDDTTQWCECDKCRALLRQPDKRAPFGGLDRSALYCRMIKAVSEGVERELPGRRIAFNHYYNLENLPTDASGKVMTDVMPGRSVLSAVDDYHQCDRHPFSDKSCPFGKRIEPIAKMWSPYYGDSVSWTYYFAWNFTKGLPVSIVHKIPNDFRFIRALGINGVLDNVTLDPGSVNWFNNQLNFYVYAKAAWNPELNVDETVADYQRAYYGPAATPMGKAWRVLEDATRKYGGEPTFMPDDAQLSKSHAFHGRFRDIEDAAGNYGSVAADRDLRYLVPNRQVFDQLMASLNDAGALAGEEPYARRVNTLRSTLAGWGEARPDAKFQVFGYMNGGGNRHWMLYSGTPDGNKVCSVFGGNNVGDCFWPRPLGKEQLAAAGDRVEVTVEINVDAAALGCPLYRSGPGLYQAQDQSSSCGKEGARSACLYISDVDSDAPANRRVVLIGNDGRYATSEEFSVGESWQPGRAVTLRIEYLRPAGGGHVYRYSFNSGSGWTTVGELQFAERLAFAGPCFHFTVADRNAVRYPIMNWASFSEFEVNPSH